MPDAAAVPPHADNDGARGGPGRRAHLAGSLAAPLPGPMPGMLPGGLTAMARATSPTMPTTAPRLSLCFARTELGDRLVRESQTVLPLHVARLLLLFEGPQTVDDLRRMIDAPWLPEALIELERRRLIHRTTPQLPQPRSLALEALQLRDARRPASGEPARDRRRARTRVVVLRLLGSLGNDMARRIDQCRSAQELDELMPQVDALIEAIAGRDALGEFRLQTPRSS